MADYSKYNNYDKFPAIEVVGHDNAVVTGYRDIVKTILARATSKRTVITLDFYAGVYFDKVIDGLRGLNPVLSIDSAKCMQPHEATDKLLYDYLGEDRVFGFMCHKPLAVFFDEKKVEKEKSRIKEIKEGIILVYGIGASLITRGDIHIYADMARWEIQNRYKAGMPNINSDNSSAPFLTKYKRGYFVEWRMLDRHKRECLDTLDYILDTNSETPKLLSGDAFRAGLNQAANKPFRLVPYFDPGVWGGQWMKDVCGLDKSKINYAWSFDGVPEENSVYLKFGDINVEVPAIDIVFYKPAELLGERVHGRFGDEFPIRFDFLDTMDGGNLSLQVHPLTEYIQKTFGMNYTQDESYYILDCKEDCYVYLGVLDNVNKDELYSELAAAQTGAGFDAEKFANKVKIKKHDHVLIPAGTLHCSGKDTMVLEISSTPYIFTFKLWDWGRIGLDGLPRPTHIDHGIHNIKFDRTPDWVEKNLLNRTEIIASDKYTVIERTGLHEREFIETIRYSSCVPVTVENKGSVNMLNVVSGEAVLITSPDKRFEPYKVHYAETFIVPASVGTYRIEPAGKDKNFAVIQAKVR